MSRYKPFIQGVTYNAGLQARMRSAGIVLSEKSKGEFNHDIADEIGLNASIMGILPKRHIQDDVWDAAEAQREADKRSSKLYD